MMNKTSQKFIVWAVVIVGAGALVYVAGNYFNPDLRAKRAELRELQELKEQYENDIYGGATPEETLSLFIGALEAGDVELASKYFVIDEQEQSLISLGGIKANDNLQNIINDFGRAKLGEEIFKDHYQFTVLYESTKNAEFTIDLIKDPLSGKWKLDKLF